MPKRVKRESLVIGKVAEVKLKKKGKRVKEGRSSKQ
jgi:hypothetical protein